MNVTKSLAELCPLLIDEIYGELPSRIYSTLITRGRSTLSQLRHYTALTERQLRHGLAVLIQQNLLYFHTDSDTRTTTYEANSRPAYNLVRTGKILEMIETSYGPAVKDVMQSLFILGQTRIEDLKAAYKVRIRQQDEVAGATEDDIMFDGAEVAPAANKPTLPVPSIAKLNNILCRLVETGLVEVVHVQTFASPEDIFSDVSDRVMRNKFPGGVKGAKGKLEFDEAVAMELRKIRRESTTLKRKLEESGSAAKRRKLLNGAGVNSEHEPEGDPVLDPRQVIRVNYDKCVVELRNRRLVDFAADRIGTHISYVYGTVLKLLSKHIPRCHDDPLMDVGEMRDEDTRPRVVTTNEILNSLPTAVDVSQGVAKVSKNRIDIYSATAVRPNPPATDPVSAILNGNNEEDGGSDDDSDYEGPNGHPAADDSAAVDGDGGVRFAETTHKENRVDMLRQHLYLLAESELNFIRHCGEEQWTVDFKPLIQHLKEAELDVVIEHTVGRQGLRLVRILRKRGKLEEKSLPTIALMKKPDVQTKMLEMQTAGFVDVQEVPRDPSRTANRTIFLWYTATDRCISQLLERTYTTMLRCLQRLHAERRKEKDVLLLTKRTDVKGREQEVMAEGYYQRFAAHLEAEKKLLGQVMRLDELVAVLRDY